MTTIQRAKSLVWRYVVPLIAWAIVLQLLFDGPWMAHEISLYSLLCYLLIVFGGNIIATDTKRILQYLILLQRGRATPTDSVLTIRCLGTTLLILLEIATTLWDQRAGKTGVHFPLAVRVVVLTISLPAFFYTSRVLLRKQDQAVLLDKLAGGE